LLASASGGTPVLRHAVWSAAVLLLLSAQPAWAHILPRPWELERVNRGLHGQVIDHTNNHGHNRALWSPALCEYRDLYVYLPPCFDPHKQYPLVIYLHGFAQDEHSFLRDIVERIDQAIWCGKLPPVIVAAPDGSLRGSDCLFTAGSFFLNTKAGAFEDYLMIDVWDFLMKNYPIRPEPEAHVIAGASMGGGAAFNKAIKFQDRFKTVIGIFPPLNTRWISCRGRYMDNFDPNCWGWREDFSHGLEVVGRFYGVVTIRMRQVSFPLYGRNNPDTAMLVSRENPIELLDAYDVRDGQIAMYVAYGGLDQFNLDAQVESFLYHAKERGITVDVAYDPRGKHDLATALRLMPGALEWLAPRLAPYAPK
jgi:S-formylglutathione hydrolase FrmB